MIELRRLLDLQVLYRSSCFDRLGKPVFQWNDLDTRIAQLLSEYDCSTLLDVGCGAGRRTVEMKRTSGASEAYGVDISADAVEITRSRGIHAIEVDLNREKLPFQDEQFDLVSSIEVLDYISGTSNYFSEVNRVLDRDGVFLLSTVNLSAFHNRVAMAVGQTPFPLRPEYGRVHSERGPGVVERADRINVLRFEEIRRVLDRHGFLIDQFYGCTAKHDGLPLPLRLLDHICSYWPRLSYRILFVCRKDVD